MCVPPSLPPVFLLSPVVTPKMHTTEVISTGGILLFRLNALDTVNTLHPGMNRQINVLLQWVETRTGEWRTRFCFIIVPSINERKGGETLKEPSLFNRRQHSVFTPCRWKKNVWKYLGKLKYCVCFGVFFFFKNKCNYTFYIFITNILIQSYIFSKKQIKKIKK